MGYKAVTVNPVATKKAKELDDTINQKLTIENQESLTRVENAHYFLRFLAIQYWRYDA